MAKGLPAKLGGAAGGGHSGRGKKQRSGKRGGRY